MFSNTHTSENPKFTVVTNDSLCSRLNCLRHIFNKVPYEDLTPPPIKMPKQGSQKRPPLNEQVFVPNNYPYKN